MIILRWGRRRRATFLVTRVVLLRWLSRLLLLLLLRRIWRRKFCGVRFLLVSHAMILAAKTVATEGALELTVARVNNVVTLKVLAGRESLRALAALKLFLAAVTLAVRRRHRTATVRHCHVAGGNC